MRFLSVLFVATLCCCKAASTTSHEQATFEQIVESEIGANAIIEKNNPLTFALAYHTNNRSVDYLIIRLSDLKIVVKEKIQGSVTWDGAMRIKVITMPGIVKMNSKPEDKVRIIDLNNYVIHKK
jgi:hypothetical protein